jgi:hypothetical protein
MEEIKAKQPGELTEEDAIYLDAHLATDLFLNWLESTQKKIEAILTPLVERGTTLLKGVDPVQRNLSPDQGEKLSELVTEIMNVEVMWQNVIRASLEWTQAHGRELVGEANYERIEVLLGEREQRKNDTEALMGGTVDGGGETLL